jgi:hypothetical protein
VIAVPCFEQAYGAHNRIWTGDLSLTKEVLYRLSYVGVTIFFLKLRLLLNINQKKEITTLKHVKQALLRS